LHAGLVSTVKLLGGITDEIHTDQLVDPLLGRLSSSCVQVIPHHVLLTCPTTSVLTAATYTRRLDVRCCATHFPLHSLLLLVVLAHAAAMLALPLSIMYYVLACDTHCCTMQGPPDLQQLQQQLVSNVTFQQLLEQPDKVAAVLQADPTLQLAAANNPDIAQLLDPATMQQTLQLLTQQQLSAGSLTDAAPGAPQIQRKALMQLQNYALQLQQARAAGTDTRNLRDTSAWQQQQQGLAAGNGSSSSSQDAMWQQLQQRLSKYHLRSQALAAAGQQQPGALNLQQQQQLQDQQLAAAAAAAVRDSRPSDGSSTMQELLSAFPDMLAAAAANGPMNGSHATIGLLSAVSEQPPLEAAASAAAAVSLSLGAAAAAAAAAPLAAGSSGSVGMPAQLQLLQQLQQPQLQPSEPLALPFSPNWQQQQQLGSAGMPWPPLSAGNQPSFPAAAAAAAAPFGLSEGNSSGSSLTRLSNPLARCGSAQGHRILLPHSSSPIPSGSGSTPLGIEQLGSGEVIVDITPPTKITKKLSWSLDPDADYVLDASASGSFSPLDMSAAAAAAAAAAGWGGSAAAAAAAASAGAFNGAASWGASLDSLSGQSTGSGTGLAAAAAAAAGRGAGMVHSSSAGTYQGLYSSTLHGQAGLQPLLENSSSEPIAAGAAAAAAAIDRPAGQAARVAAAAAAAAGLQPHLPVLGVTGKAPGAAPAAAAAAARGPRLSTTSSTGSGGSSSSSAKAHVPRVKANGLAAAAVGSRGAGAHAPADATLQPQQQQQPVLPMSTSSSSSTTSWLGAGSSHAAAAANGPQGGYLQQPYSADYSTLQQQQQQQGSGSAGFNRKTLNPRSYYEDVAPSSWRPSDAAEVQGDYLELYRWDDCH
jgi:hypothetical protein